MGGCDGRLGFARVESGQKVSFTAKMGRRETGWVPLFISEKQRGSG